MENKLDKLASLCKRRGIIFPGSEIYGGLAGTWDYGPAGSLLKKNIKDLWWKEMVQLRNDVVGLDAAIFMNPKAWEASGHTQSFTDPLIECKVCHQRIRADQSEEKDEHEKTHKEMVVEWTEPQQFNLLVSAYLGVIEGKKMEVFLRGEITNGVQVNFKNVVNSTRIKIPFGIAQMGKAFRNEITPGNFTFRSREFEQMEVQYFIRPDEKEGEKWFEYWKQNRMDWFLKLGVNKTKLRFKDHEPEKRAHYARMATDIEYETPWGWAEWMGIHHRGDWDQRRHEEFSKQNLKYHDPETGEEYTPWDIETSCGIDRSILFFLLDAYAEEEKRTVLKLHPLLSPYKIAVFPLLANKPDLIEKAKKIYEDLRKEFMVAWDDRGNIGKRYLAQDEIGTPWCVTIDFQTIADDTITIRDRDTTTQIRVKADALKDWFLNKLNL